MKKLEEAVVTLENYQELANRTFKRSPVRGVDSIHMAAGMVTELHLELAQALEKDDRANIIEEIGDAMWFMAGECTIMGWAFQELFEQANVFPIKEKNLDSKTAVNILDIHKAELVYGRAVKKHIVHIYLLEALKTLVFIMDREKIDPINVMDVNIKKLVKRFPEQFSEFLANNRDLSAERKILEDGANKVNKNSNKTKK